MYDVIDTFVSSYAKYDFVECSNSGATAIQNIKNKLKF